MAINLLTVRAPIGEDVTQEQIEAEIDGVMRDPTYVAAFVEGEGPDRHLVVIRPTLASSLELTIQGVTAQEYFKGHNVRKLVEDFETAQDLGVLSAKYESTGSSKAIGFDSVGGPSWGRYQIATYTGTMKTFLSFLNRARPDMADDLLEVGGAEAASQGEEGTPEFKAAWLKLAEDPEFQKLEHGFIRITHFDPFVYALRDGPLALDVMVRSNALQNVAWSTAVQHGPGNNVFVNALSGAGPVADLEDKAMIERIYAERSKVDVYFSRSTPAVKDSVKERFEKELADALAMLA